MKPIGQEWICYNSVTPRYDTDCADSHELNFRDFFTTGCAGFTGCGWEMEAGRWESGRRTGIPVHSVNPVKMPCRSLRLPASFTPVFTGLRRGKLTRRVAVKPTRCCCTSPLCGLLLLEPCRFILIKLAHPGSGRALSLLTEHRLPGVRLSQDGAFSLPSYSLHCNAGAALAALKLA